MLLMRVRRFQTLLTTVFGTMVIVLLCGCPSADITLPGINADPVADAGPDQTVDVGGRVTLSGLSSTDADDDPLTFSVTFSTKDSIGGGAPAIRIASGWSGAIPNASSTCSRAAACTPAGTAGNSDTAAIVAASAPVASTAEKRLMPNHHSFP